ncbi:hypothetical protein JTB14_002864 [Gonioctena quinquepunctata]|nr:hypothetical protein JTB14_002864 [Gonioctena quinquepunctata]
MSLKTPIPHCTGKIIQPYLVTDNGRWVDVEYPDPDGLTTESGSSSECNKEISRPTSIVPSSCTKGLSRRQRKNRRREDTSPPENQKLKTQKTKKSPDSLPTSAKKQVMAVVSLRQCLKFSAPEKTFVEPLHNYLLPHDEMFSMGYPIESTLYPNFVRIYRDPSFPMFPVHLKVVDVNAREFVPKNECNSNDSGQGSASSSDCGENFDGEDSSSMDSWDKFCGIYIDPSIPMFPVHLTVFDVNAREFVPKNECNSNDSGQGSGSSSDCGENSDGEDSRSSSVSYQDAGTYFKQNEVSQHSPSGEYFVRNCCRCGQIFYSTSHAYITKEKCYYHWGRLQKLNSSGDEENAVYHCCRGKIGSQGCTEGRLHVWAGLHSE